MKYIDAEKLLAALERQNADKNIIQPLIRIIDSLQQEQPVEGLEEAADAHIRRVADAAGHPGWDWTTQDIAEAFIAGAKRMAEHLKR